VSHRLAAASSGTGRPSVHFLGGEAELVEAAPPLSDAEPLLVHRDDLLAGELVPQAFVPAVGFLGDLERIDAGREDARGFQVEQFPVHPLHGEFDVVPALAAGQFRMLLAGLRVDEVSLQGAGVVAEQGVGQRAVTPKEA
jgi:hypothetical protein